MKYVIGERGAGGGRGWVRHGGVGLGGTEQAWGWVQYQGWSGRAEDEFMMINDGQRQ